MQQNQDSDNDDSAAEYEEVLNEYGNSDNDDDSDS